MSGRSTMQLDVGLADGAFDRENPEYGFRRDRYCRRFFRFAKAKAAIAPERLAGDDTPVSDRCLRAAPA